MPDRTVCPRCKSVGLVRSEHVIKGGKAERHYYCGACEHSWITVEGADSGTNTK
jgi:transposase-like protein